MPAQANPVFTAESAAVLEKAIEQVDAIFAFEGFTPDLQKKAIDAALIAGRVTLPQVIAEMRDYAIANKGISGFVESRDWAQTNGTHWWKSLSKPTAYTLFLKETVVVCRCL